jgi:hypothetical protein
MGIYQFPASPQVGDSRSFASDRISPLRLRSPHRCEVCDFPLTGRPAWWNLCWQCFRGAQLYRAVRIYQSRG